MPKDKARLAAWLIPLVALIVYLSFPTRVYYFDGISFAQTIEDAPRLSAWLIHPNHLFYNVLGYLAYSPLRALGLEVRAVTVLQILNGLLGALSAFALFQILRLSIRSLYLSYWLTALFAFSATWWKFSTDADAYIPSVLFVLISFYLVHPSLKARPLLLAVAFSASMLLHQLAVIFFPVLVLGLWLQDREREGRRRLYTLLLFGLAAFVITFGTYYYCFYLTTGSLDLRRLMRWMTSFSPDASFSFNARQNLFYTVRGHWRLFFGGRLNALKGLINPFIVLLMILLGAAFALFIASLVRGWKENRLPERWRLKIDERLKPLALLCGLWISVYLIYLFFWLPHHTYYRLFYLPALILLAGLLLDSREKVGPGRRYRLALFVTILALCNFLFLTYPYSHTEKYPPLALALQMNGLWPQGTVIYYGSVNSDNSLFHYFNRATVWKPLPSTATSDLDKELKDVYGRGGTAWLDISAVEQISATTEGAGWLNRHIRAESSRELIDRAYKIRFVQVAP